MKQLRLRMRKVINLLLVTEQLRSDTKILISILKYSVLNLCQNSGYLAFSVPYTIFLYFHRLPYNYIVKGKKQGKVVPVLN
jgi:hypothetical protein